MYEILKCVESTIVDHHSSRNPLKFFYSNSMHVVYFTLIVFSVLSPVYCSLVWFVAAIIFFGFFHCKKIAEVFRDGIRLGPTDEVLL